MKTFVLSALIVGLVCSPGYSQIDLVRQVRVGNNDGQTRQTVPETIYLANGYSVTINFLASNEEITQVWLSNPSFVVVMSDGCLTRGATRQNCQHSSNPVKVLHLKRINDLTIPGLPKTGQSLLTIVTRSSSGKGNIYLFKIVKSSSPGHLVFEIAPSNSTEPVIDTSVLQTFRQGVLIAKQQKFLEEGSALDKKINSFLAYLSEGLSVSESTNKAGLSPDVVSRLQELGQ